MPEDRDIQDIITSLKKNNEKMAKQVEDLSDTVKDNTDAASKSQKKVSENLEETSKALKKQADDNKKADKTRQEKLDKQAKEIAVPPREKTEFGKRLEKGLKGIRETFSDIKERGVLGIAGKKIFERLTTKKAIVPEISLGGETPIGALPPVPAELAVLQSGTVSEKLDSIKKSIEETTQTVETGVSADNKSRDKLAKEKTKQDIISKDLKKTQRLNLPSFAAGGRGRGLLGTLGKAGLILGAAAIRVAQGFDDTNAEIAADLEKAQKGGLVSTVLFGLDPKRIGQAASLVGRIFEARKLRFETEERIAKQQVLIDQDILELKEAGFTALSQKQKGVAVQSEKELVSALKSGQIIDEESLIRQARNSLLLRLEKPTEEAVKSQITRFKIEAGLAVTEQEIKQRSVSLTRRLAEKDAASLQARGGFDESAKKVEEKFLKNLRKRGQIADEEVEVTVQGLKRKKDILVTEKATMVALPEGKSKKIGMMESAMTTKMREDAKNREAIERATAPPASVAPPIVQPFQSAPRKDPMVIESGQGAEMVRDSARTL